MRRWLVVGAAGAFLGADWGAAIAVAIPTEASLAIVLGVACLGVLVACMVVRDQKHKR